MKSEKDFKKEYEEYLKKFEEEKESGRIPPKAKPMSFNDFIPDSYKY